MFKWQWMAIYLEFEAFNKILSTRDGTVAGSPPVIFILFTRIPFSIKASTISHNLSLLKFTLLPAWSALEQKLHRALQVLVTLTNKLTEGATGFGVPMPWLHPTVFNEISLLNVVTNI